MTRNHKKIDTMALDEIDAHLDEHLHDQLSETSKFCELYKVARPILKFAVSILFFKPKWQEVLRMLIANMDNACDL